MIMRAGWAALAGLALLTGASPAAEAACFTSRAVLLPDPALVLPVLSNGAAGRALAQAVWRGDAAEAAARLAADPRLADTAVMDDPALTNQPDGRYGDLLAFAVARCDRPMLETLLAAGLDPDGARPGEALLLALLSDDPMLPETLLAAGATPDPQKAGGTDVLMGIGGFDHVGAAMMLVRHGLATAWVDQFGRTHLDTALSMRAYLVAEVLVGAGADLCAEDRDGYSPAHALAAPPLVVLSAEQAAARARLIEGARAGGRPWPPPRPGR